MSYKTYTTEALVCGSAYSNTSDKSYLLFTKEAGMVWATARSVREERSKQRYALQDFSCIRVSLVKGRSGWRIGSVEALGNPFMKAETRSKRGIVSFLVRQLRRYVHGEIELEKTYHDVTLLLGNASNTETQVELLQQLFLVRLLTELGYIAVDPSWKTLIEAKTVLDALELYEDRMETLIHKAIEKGSNASHL